MVLSNQKRNQEIKRDILKPIKDVCMYFINRCNITLTILALTRVDCRLQ